jgi:hypothetical protein
MTRIEMLRNHVASLERLIKLIGPWDGKFTRKLSEANRAALTAAISEVWEKAEAQGYLNQSWYYDPSSSTWKVDLAPARSELANAQAAVAAWEKYNDIPQVAQLRSLETQIREAWTSLRKSVGEAEYLNMLRAGVLPGINFQ